MIAGWPAPDGDEYAVAFDRGRERRLLILPALFDEANKLRRFTVQVMRVLDDYGVDVFLPDLPGCNESLSSLDKQTLSGWRASSEAAARHFAATHILTVRAGALCVPASLPIFCFAPVTGSSLLRAMVRARIIASKEAGIEEAREALLEQGRRSGIELAGHSLGPQMIREIETAELSDSPQTTEISQAEIGGARLWLRAEPDEDPEQARELAGLMALYLNV